MGRTLGTATVESKGGRTDPHMIKTDVLTPGQARAVSDLMETVTEHDSVAALDEAARLQLKASARRRGVWHLLEYSRERVLVGYASILSDGTVQGMVHPEHRHQGHGTALLTRAMTLTPNPAVWVHGADSDTSSFLRSHGFKSTRELVTMSLELEPCAAEHTVPDLSLIHI